MKVTYSEDIECAPEGVWYWLGDPERAKQWQTNVGETRIIHKEPGWVGTTFTEVVRDDSGSTEMHGVVTDYRENRALAMHLEGRYNVVELEWRIEPAGEHTRITIDADVRFKGLLGITSLLLRPVFKKNLLAELSAEFARLKELCEKSE